MNVQSLTRLTRLTGVLLLAAASAHGQLLLSDDFTVVNVTSGFALGNGVNSGINPPTTRMTGSLADNMRYYQTVTTGKPTTVFDINSNRLRVNTDGGIGRFTLSTDGSTPYDFSSALGSATATASSPVTYDLRISMRNNASTAPKFSFALGTAEGDATTWDFGIQLFRNTTSDNFYTIQKRLDSGSIGIADVNAVMGTTAAGTWVSGSQATINFLMRVTDAGSESGTYNSRVQVSTDNGASWLYDTATDGTLINGFHFDGSGRFIMFDQAGNTSAAVFYDNFSVTVVPEPSVYLLGGLAALVFVIRRKLKS